MKRFLTVLCICLLVIATTSLTACELPDFVSDWITPEPQVYTITFEDFDGTVLQTVEVTENAEIAFSGETPTRAADAQYTYQFVGWKDAEGMILAQLPTATQDATFTAHYNKTVNKYTVEFKNGDEVLQSESLEYGAVPVFKGETPTTDATAQYTYVFSGWKNGENHYATSVSLPVVTGDVTYEANFSSTVNSYEVTWNVLGTETSSTLEYGSAPTFGGTPEKAGNAQYSYTFAGWSLTEGGDALTAEQMTVVADVKYYAVFTESVNEYRVTFVDENDKELYAQNVAYGSSPVFGGTLPTLTNTAQYTYEYLGWIVGDAIYSFADTLPQVKGEMTLKLKLETTVNEYTVTWVVEGETTEKVLAYGAAPEYRGTPAKAGNEEYEYEFAGWSLTEGGELVEIATVTNDVTYYAIFNAVKNQYEVKFVDEEGKELYKTTLGYGSAVSYQGEKPEKEKTAQFSYVPAWKLGETVYGYEDTLPALTGNTTYVLTFTSVINQYTITINYEVVDSVLTSLPTKTLTLDYGTSYGEDETASPEQSGYAPDRYWFAGILTGDVTYTVKYHAVDVWDGTTAEAFASGTGTEEDPYIIMTGAQLAYLAQLGMDNTTAKGDVYGTGIYYKLGASLDLSEHQWTPIAFRDSASLYNWTYFGGNFDGAGHTIIMNISNTGFGYGLFQGVAGTVNNLTLAGSINSAHRAGSVAYMATDTAKLENIVSYVDLTMSATDGYVGGFLGGTGAGEINNCINYGDINATTSSYIGGISGKFTTTGVISNCANYGSITGGKYTGGMAGSLAASATIKDSSNYGKINTSVEIVGGVVGHAGKASTIIGCVNYGDIVSTKTKCAGIVGNTESAILTNCSNYGTITGAGTTAGISGNTTSASVLTLCTNYGAIIGSGSQTAGVAAYTGAGVSMYGCVNHGNISNTANTTGGVAATGKGYIGVYEDDDGNIYKTVNYGNVTSTGKYTGGVTGNTESTTLDRCENYGTISGADRVGGVTGQVANGSTALLCVNYGKVYATSEDSGGFCGYVGNGSSVKGCINNGDVYSTATDIGGIVGENQGYVGSYEDAEGVIHKLINNGNVYGEASNVGGITGTHAKETAVTENAENYGKVYGAADRVGGIVGDNNSATVQNCVNYGDVEGGAGNVGGCIGRNNAGLLATNLTNYGKVVAITEKGIAIGGVIGNNCNSSPASNLTNHGDVYGYTQVGGVSGYQGAGSSIDVAVNNGKVYAYSSSVGQIVGTNNAPDETTNVTGNGSAEVIVEE